MNSSSPQHPGTAQADKVSLVGRRREEEASASGDAAARRAINSLSVTSSIISALIQHPGPGGDHESLVNAARTMLRNSDEVTQRLLVDLKMEGLGWAKYRTLKMVTAAVAEAWITSAKDGGTASADVTSLLPVWREIASHSLPELVFDEPAESTRVAIQCALLDAMEPVMRAISIFDMFRDPKQSALHARDKITAFAQVALDQLVDQHASTRSRHQLLQSLLRNAGTIYASAWRRHADDTVGDLMAMEPSQQKLTLEMNPEGLPLVAIDEAFSESFAKLVDMVHFLSSPKTSPKAEAREALTPSSEDLHPKGAMPAPVQAVASVVPESHAAALSTASVADPLAASL